jgi:anti-anti-sigma factor
MQLTRHCEDGGLTLVRCAGKITQALLPAEKELLIELLGAQTYNRRLLLDLTQTSYIDSSGVSWMLIQHKRFLQAGGKIVFHSAPPLVQQTLDLLRMNLVLNLAADEAAARRLALEDRS